MWGAATRSSWAFLGLCRRCWAARGRRPRRGRPNGDRRRGPRAGGRFVCGAALGPCAAGAVLRYCDRAARAEFWSRCWIGPTTALLQQAVPAASRGAARGRFTALTVGVRRRRRRGRSPLGGGLKPRAAVAFAVAAAASCRPCCSSWRRGCWTGVPPCGSFVSRRSAHGPRTVTRSRGRWRRWGRRRPRRRPAACPAPAPARAAAVVDTLDVPRASDSTATRPPRAHAQRGALRVQSGVERRLVCASLEEPVVVEPPRAARRDLREDEVDVGRRQPRRKVWRPDTSFAHCVVTPRSTPSRGLRPRSA